MPEFDTEHTALVIVDLVQDFFEPGIWPDSLIPKARKILVKNTNQLLASCRKNKIPVVWIKQAFKADLSDAFPHMRRSGKKYTISGTDGCEILPELHVLPEDHVVLKSRFSAFFRTDLDQLLQKLHIKHLMLAGITTAWCIRSTAVDGYQRDYDIIIAKDCTLAFTETDHLQSLEAMDGYIAAVLSNSEIIEYASHESRQKQ